MKGGESMELTSKDRAALIESIARNIAAIEARHAYLSRAQVAMKLGYTYSGVGAVLEAPGFPRPVRLTPGAKPRWKNGDIQDWADKQKTQL